MRIFPATTRPLADEIAPRRRHAERLYAAAAALVAVLPLAMLVATRSAPAVMSAAAVAALAGLLIENSAAGFRSRISAWRPEPFGWSVIGFALWVLISLTWTPFTALSLRVLGELAVSVGAVLVLVLVLPGRIDPLFWGRLGACSAVLAAILLVLDMKSGLEVRAALGGRALPFVLNRPALTLLVLIPGLAVLLVRRKQAWLAACVALCAAVAILVSFSGAAKFGLVAGAAGFVLAWWAPRIGLALTAVALLGSIALAPVLGEIADRLLPRPLVQRLERAHAQDRIDIWRSFGAAIREQPWAGAGFGTSALFGQTPVAQRLRPEYQPLLDIGHPHNAPLQIWAELGAIGAGLAAMIAALALRAIDRLPRPHVAAALALAGAALAASLVGQGAWQGWWPAAIGASILWFRLAASRRF